jgi:hypothetical protein
MICALQTVYIKAKRPLLSCFLGPLVHQSSWALPEHDHVPLSRPNQLLLRDVSDFEELLHFSYNISNYRGHSFESREIAVRTKVGAVCQHDASGADEGSSAHICNHNRGCVV